MDVTSRHSPQAKHQVFVNFRGDELRCGFVSHLVEALQRQRINVFIDKLERIGEDLSNLFVRIEESTIALVIFSRRYMESKWCLDELVKIKQRADQGLLRVIPIFFKVDPVTVKQLRGAFGDQFRDREWEYRFDKPIIERWKEALASVSCKIGLTFDKKRIIVKEVEKMLQLQGNSAVNPFPGDTYSIGRQRMNNLASTLEPVEVSIERVLVQEISEIASQIVVASKGYSDMECENTVLRAQIVGLSERLQSLNSIIEMVEGVVGEVPETPDFLMNPWQLPYSSQLIMTSADMFHF
ncbi:vesicle-associated protein 1-4 isoform X2 [Eutrema salsugineum]|uniref:vesicle-associated protein 1-4 isoform X2 n=1 Tax=Eutrema salsugineum TaxID=72664 RepID=UPI000CED70BF|nr:vesicle-associated protein 1-4 isoform X2 [Eutrema salsugineum]